MSTKRSKIVRSVPDVMDAGISNIWKILEGTKRSQTCSLPDSGYLKKRTSGKHFSLFREIRLSIKVELSEIPRKSNIAI